MNGNMVSLIQSNYGGMDSGLHNRGQIFNVLIGKGHEVSYGRMDQFGGYQAIKYDAKNKVYYGASESRKDGYAGGY